MPPYSVPITVPFQAPAVTVVTPTLPSVVVPVTSSVPDAVKLPRVKCRSAESARSRMPNVVELTRFRRTSCAVAEPTPKPIPPTPPAVVFNDTRGTVSPVTPKLGPRLPAARSHNPSAVRSIFVRTIAALDLMLAFVRLPLTTVSTSVKLLFIWDDWIVVPAVKSYGIVSVSANAGDAPSTPMIAAQIRLLILGNTFSPPC